MYHSYGQDSLEVSSNAKSAAVVLRLGREVGLDKKQEVQVYDIMQERWSGLAKLKTTQVSITRESIDDQTVADLKKVLTESQFSKFLELRLERRKHKKEFMSKNPGYRFSEVDKDLDF